MRRPLPLSLAERAMHTSIRWCNMTCEPHREIERLRLEIEERQRLIADEEAKLAALPPELPETHSDEEGLTLENVDHEEATLSHLLYQAAQELHPDFKRKKPKIEEVVLARHSSKDYEPTIEEVVLAGQSPKDYGALERSIERARRVREYLNRGENGGWEFVSSQGNSDSGDITLYFKNKIGRKRAIRIVDGYIVSDGYVLEEVKA